MLAPRCAHCECTIIGHGVEASGKYYCCVHCAEQSGVHGLRDRKHAASGGSGRAHDMNRP